MCAPSSIQRLASRRRRAVQVIATQQKIIARVEGKNPLMPVATGKASIPPPILVPPTRKIAEIIFAFEGAVSASKRILLSDLLGK